MSGVVIEVDSRTNKARKELAEINRNLAQMVRNGNAAQKSTVALDKKALSNVNKSVKDVNRSFAGFDKNISATKVLSSGAETATKSFGGLKTAVFSLAAAFAAIKGVGFYNETADELTRIQNKLRLVTDTTEELMIAQRKLYSISRESWTTFQGTADVFFNIARSMQETGMATNVMFEITNTLQKTIAISGTTAQGASAALIQLNQGMASGTLRGEELNSVLEQIPRLGMLLTKSLNMNTGSLRKYAEEGKLTTNVVLGIIRDNKDIIDKEFNVTIQTASQAFEQLNGAIRLLFGTLNQRMGSAENFTRILNNITVSLNSFNDSFMARIYAANIGLKNYIYNLDKFSAMMLAFNAYKRSEISLFDIAKAYREYKQVKGILEDYRNLKLEPPKFDIKQDNKTVDEEKKTMKERIKEVVNVASAAFGAFTGLFSKFKWLIPDIRVPLRTLAIDIGASYRIVNKEITAWAYLFLSPFNRILEGYNEFINSFLKGDHELERAWVNVFRSDSMESLANNLRDLEEAARAFRFNDLAIFKKDVKSVFSGFVEDGKAVLRYLGILNNRLLFVNNVRFDRVISGFKTLGSIVKRVYDDVVAPRLIPLLYRNVISPIIAAFQALRDAISDKLDNIDPEDLGKRLGHAIIAGFSSSFETAKKLFNKVFKSKLSVDLNISNNPFEKMLEILTKIVLAVKDFGKGLFEGLELPSFREKVTGLVTLIPKLDMSSIRMREFKFKFTADPSVFREILHMFDEMVLKVDEGARKLNNVVRNRIETFGETVKDVFYNVYDEVVGHSFWPDTIDGINRYVTNLSISEDRIEKFEDTIINSFKRTMDALKSNDNVLIRIKAKLDKIDWGDSGRKLGDYIGASILAAVLYAFGNVKMKIAASGFFFSFFSTELISKAGNQIAAVMAQVGNSAGVLVQTALSSALNALNSFVNAAPEFVKGFLDGLGPIGKGITSLFNLIPESGLFTSILLGAGGYALLAKNGFKNLKELVMGKEIKKGPNKGQQTDGIKSYVSSILGLQSGASGALSKSILGNNPGLLLAGIGVASTAFLDSVSLIEASLLGVPMIVTALLGKDGGGRAIRDVLKATARMAGDVFQTLLNVTRKDSGKTNIGDLLGKGSGQMDFVTAQREKPKSKSYRFMAGRHLLDAMKTAIDNVQANLAEYAAGKISLSDLFLNTTSASGVKSRLAIAAKFKGFLHELKMFKVGGISFDTLQTAISNGFSTALSMATTGIPAITGGIANAFTSMTSVISGAFLFVLSGLRLVFSFLLTKLGVFVVLSGLLIKSANAASDFGTVMSDIGSNLGSMLSVVTKATLALGALGVAYKGFQVFKAGRSLFAQDQGDLAANSIETIKAARAAFNKTIKEKNIFGKRNTFAQATEASQGVIDKARSDAIAASATGLPSIKAGLFAVGDWLNNSTKGLQNKVSAVANFVTKKLFSKAWWSEVNMDIDDFSDKWFDWLGKITPWLIRMNDKLTELFKDGFLAGIKNSAVLLWNMIAVNGVAIALRTTLDAIWLRLAPILLPFIKIAAVIGGIGGLALALFGPGNSFFENLEWAYDKIKEMFGFEATGTVSKLSKLTDSIKPVKIGMDTVDFTKQFQNIDIAAMSSTQYKVLSDVSTTSGEALQKLAELYEKQGKLTDEQMDELKSIKREMSDQLIKAPTKEPDSLSELGRRTERNLMSVDNSTNGKLRRAWESVFGKPELLFPLAAAKSSVKIWFDLLWDVTWKGWGLYFDKLIDNVSNFDLGREFNKVASSLTPGFTLMRTNFDILFAVINKRLTALPKFDQANQASQFRTAFVSLEKNFKYLSDYEQNRIREGLVNRNTAKEDLDAYLFRGKKGDEPRGYYENLGNKSTKYNTEAAKSDADIAYYASIAQRRANVDTYNKSMEEFSQTVKTFLKLDFGKNGIDFLGTDEQKKKLESLVSQAKLAKSIIEDFGENSEKARPQKQLLVNIEAEAKRLEDEIKETTSFKGIFEYQVKLTGIDTTTEALARMYSTSRGDFEEWQQAVEELTTANNEYAALRITKAKAEDIIKSLERIRNAKERIEETAPKKTFFDDINASLTKLGESPVDLGIMTGFTEEASSRIQRVIKDAIKSKQNLLDLTGKKAPFSDQILALNKMLDAVRKVKFEVGLARNRAYNNLIKDAGNDPFKQRRVTEEFFGETPDGVSAGEEPQYRAIQKRLAKTNLDLSTVELGNSPEAYKIYRKLLADRTRDTKALAKISEEQGTFSDVISNVNSLGFEFNANTPYNTKTLEHLKLADKLVKNVNDQIAETPKDSVTKDMLKRWTGDLDKARELASKARIDSMHKTPESIKEGLSRKGLSDSNLIATLPKETLELLLKFDINDAEREKNKTKGDLDTVRKNAQAERQEQQIAAFATRTFKNKLEAVNSVFGTDISSTLFKSFSAATQASIDKFEQQLSEFDLTGSLIDLEAMAGIKELFKRQATALGLFEASKKDLFTILSEGFGAGLERVKAVGESLNAPVIGDIYKNASQDELDNFNIQASLLEQFKSAVNLAGRNPELLKILTDSSVDLGVRLEKFSEQNKINETTIPTLLGISNDYLKLISERIMPIAPGKFGGGMVRGPGTGVSDSILQPISNGEFIVKESETRKHKTLLEQINNGSFQGFAEGGYTGNPAINVLSNTYGKFQDEKPLTSMWLSLLPFIGQGLAGLEYNEAMLEGDSTAAGIAAMGILPGYKLAKGAGSLMKRGLMTRKPLYAPHSFRGQMNPLESTLNPLTQNVHKIGAFNNLNDVKQGLTGRYENDKETRRIEYELAQQKRLQELLAGSNFAGLNIPSFADGGIIDIDSMNVSALAATLQADISAYVKQLGSKHESGFITRANYNISGDKLNIPSLSKELEGNQNVTDAAGRAVQTRPLSKDDVIARYLVALHEIGHAFDFKATLSEGTQKDIAAHRDAKDWKEKLSTAGTWFNPEIRKSNDSSQSLTREFNATKFAIEKSRVPAEHNKVLATALRSYLLVNTLSGFREDPREITGLMESMDFADDGYLNDSVTYQHLQEAWPTGSKRFGDMLRVLTGYKNTSLFKRFKKFDLDKYSELEGFKPLAVGYNTGGPIKGKGTGTSDSNLAFVSNGEFIINKKSTDMFRPLLEQINDGNIPAFSTGGEIGGGVTMPTTKSKILLDAADITKPINNTGIKLTLDNTINNEALKKTAENTSAMVAVLTNKNQASSIGVSPGSEGYTAYKLIEAETKKQQKVLFELAKQRAIAQGRPEQAVSIDLQSEGFSLDASNINRMTKETRLKLEELVRAHKESSARILAGTYEDLAKEQAMRDEHGIRINEIIDKQLSVRTVKMNEAGENFATGVVESVSSGVVSVLKNYKTFKDQVKGFLDKFTSSIIETYIKGIADRFMETAAFDKLKSFGKDVYKGKGMPGGMKEQADVAKSEVKVALKQTETWLEKIYNFFTGKKDEPSEDNPKDPKTALAGLFAGEELSPGSTFSSGAKFGDGMHEATATKYGNMSATGVQANVLASQDAQFANIPGQINGIVQEPVKGFMDTLGGAFKSGLSGLQSLLKGDIGGALKGLWDFLSKGFGGLIKGISGLFSGAGGGGGSGGIGSLLGGLGSMGSLFSSFGGPGGLAGLAPMGSALEFFLFADGGKVKGKGTDTSDSIPAMLSNNEFVVNAKQTRKHLGLLNAINTGSIGKFAAGGLVGASMLSTPVAADYKPLSNNTDNSRSQQVVNVNITGDVSRQTKQEIYKMLPSIAVGVNGYNREKGIRN